MINYSVIITVKEMGGECPVYEIGDKIVVEGFYINANRSTNVCIYAFAAMTTLLSALIHGSSAKELGIGKEEDIGYLQCPDPGRPYTEGGTVLFELKRRTVKEK